MLIVKIITFQRDSQPVEVRKSVFKIIGLVKPDDPGVGLWTDAGTLPELPGKLLWTKTGLLRQPINGEISAVVQQLYASCIHRTERSPRPADKVADKLLPNEQHCIVVLHFQQLFES